MSKYDDLARIECKLEHKLGHEPEHEQEQEQEQEQEGDHGLAVAEAKPEVKQPPMYRVLLLNDDYTPMDFVIEVLRKFFSLQEEQATRVMLQVHNEGKGVCGIFTPDIAETKVVQVNDFARSNEHPLLCVMEPEA